MQECEKNLLSKYKVIFLKNYKSYDKTLQKHFNAYLSYLLKMNEVWLLCLRFFAEAHV